MRCKHERGWLFELCGVCLLMLGAGLGSACSTQALGEACHGVDCGHGNCNASGGSAVCDCDPDYHAVGLTCVADATGMTITGIEGTGAQQAVSPRPEDRAAFNEATNKVLASHRIDSNSRELVISGAGLQGVTSVTASGQNGQGTIDFEIQPGGTDTMLRLRFPMATPVVAGGLFLLTMTSGVTQVQAQVFFLQGQDGQCSNTITGDLSVSGSVNANAASIGVLTVTGTATLPNCPSGYTQDTQTTDFVLCTNSRGDEMVQVGDFWIDRYEASIWQHSDCSGMQYGVADYNYPATFPNNGNFDTPVYACSLYSVHPSRLTTWFQAQAACAASGKHLCTNAEWQAAAEGTHDPGANDGLSNTLCNTDGAGPRFTGLAGGTPGGSDSCISIWGAEDMVGNHWEMTAEWFIAGQTWQTAAGESQCESGCTFAGGWPTGYGQDATWAWNGEAIAGTGPAQGVPAMARRGGSYSGYGTKAGVFAIAVNGGPTNIDFDAGVRCCHGR